MGENTSFLEQKSWKSNTSPVNSCWWDFQSWVSWRATLPESGTSALSFAPFHRPFQLHLCIGQRVQAPQFLAQLHFFCFNFLCTFLPLQGLTVRYPRFQSDVRRFNFPHFSFFEMFVNFLTCRFHKWDPQCSWEHKTSEHLFWTR